MKRVEKKKMPEVRAYAEDEYSGYKYAEGFNQCHDLDTEYIKELNNLWEEEHKAHMESEKELCELKDVVESLTEVFDKYQNHMILVPINYGIKMLKECWNAITKAVEGYKK